jgi:hypothetical protein
MLKVADPSKWFSRSLLSSGLIVPKEEMTHGKSKEIVLARN